MPPDNTEGQSRPGRQNTSRSAALGVAFWLSIDRDDLEF